MQNGIADDGISTCLLLLLLLLLFVVVASLSRSLFNELLCHPKCMMPEVQHGNDKNNGHDMDAQPKTETQNHACPLALKCS
jgi:hypothetical protein